MNRTPHVLAVASAGGHFVQLCRLMPAWKGCRLTIVTTDSDLQGEASAAALAAELEPPGFVVVPEANRWQKLKLVLAVMATARVVLTARPEIIVTTGAAPGYLALRIGSWFGARTVWIDSIANAETLSLSGQKAGKFADLWLTQWSHLDQPKGPEYRGAVL